MTREEYLQFRNSGHIGNIIYYFYDEACKQQDVHPFPINEFMIYYSVWQEHKKCSEMVLNYYDEHFEVYELSFKGKVIRYF